MSQEVDILVTASGGGHTGYAVALAQRLFGKVELKFIIPEGDLWTKSKVIKYGEVIEVPKPRGPRDSLWTLVKGMPRALAKSLNSMPRSKIFVSSGSNHSIAPALIAKLKGSYIYNIESSVRFTSPSRSAKLLSYISDVTVLQWNEQLRILPRGRVYGPLYELPEYEIRNEGYVVVTGGTYGFKKLFDIVSELNLKKVVLQTGRVNPGLYKSRHPEWIVFDFDPEFNKWIAKADIVISHLGKTVIDAVLTYRKPTIIVPNPEWRLTASIKDARILARKLNAVLIEDLTVKALEEALDMAKRVKPPTYPDGAQKLAEEILGRLRK